jgi:hypothetical protein
MDRSLRIRFVLLGGLFLTLLVLSLALSSFYKATSRVKTLVIPPDVTSCSEDEDCGLTDQIGCCPCESGGGQAAVNKRMRRQLKAFLQGACHKRVPCVDVSACRSDLTPVCRDNVCTVATPGRT